MDSENRSKPAPSNANNWIRFLRLPSTSAVYTLLGSPKARFGFVIVMTFILAAVFAPLVAPGDPKE